MLRADEKFEHSRPPATVCIALAFRPAALRSAHARARATLHSSFALPPPVPNSGPRDTHSPFTNDESRVTHHVPEGGTLNRPRTHVTHRKQTTEHMQGRNFPVHFLFLFSPRFSRVVRTVPLGGPHTLRVLGWLSGFPETLCDLRRLPGTVNRVETYLSQRKQTPAHGSTRNVPAHRKFRLAFAFSRCACPIRIRLHWPRRCRKIAGAPWFNAND